MTGGRSNKLEPMPLHLLKIITALLIATLGLGVLMATLLLLLVGFAKTMALGALLAATGMAALYWELS